MCVQARMLAVVMEINITAAKGLSESSASIPRPTVLSDFCSVTSLLHYHIEIAMPNYDKRRMSMYEVVVASGD